jgi:hypothetical protein
MVEFTGSPPRAPSSSVDDATRRAASAAMQAERGRTNPGFGDLPSVASSITQPQAAPIPETQQQRPAPKTTQTQPPQPSHNPVLQQIRGIRPQFANPTAMPWPRMPAPINPWANRAAAPQQFQQYAPPPMQQQAPLPPQQHQQAPQQAPLPPPAAPAGPTATAAGPSAATAHPPAAIPPWIQCWPCAAACSTTCRHPPGATASAHPESR